MTDLSRATSEEDLHEMQKLALAFDRSGSGVVTSDKMSRDIQAINYTLSFHGRVLVESANLTLNYGQRCGALARLCCYIANVGDHSDTVCLARTVAERFACL